jgi:hypothetical protein
LGAGTGWRSRVYILEGYRDIGFSLEWGPPMEVPEKVLSTSTFGGYSRKQGRKTQKYVMIDNYKCIKVHFYSTVAISH